MAIEMIVPMGQDSLPTVSWREWIEQGVKDFRSARYPEAIAAFQKASDSNPQSPVPNLYLGLGWLQQYGPGDDSAANADRARLAKTAFHRALELDPNNWTAVLLLARLAADESRSDQAREWYRKAAALQPGNADIWCVLGTIGFQEWLREGRRADRIEKSIRHFEHAIALDPAHDSAMEWLSVLFRERASIRRDEKEKQEDLATARTWLAKMADARAEKFQAMIAQGISGQRDLEDPDTLLKQWTSLTLMTLPPPPPPPPPRPGGIGSASFGGESSISFVPLVQGSQPPPPPIRVAPDAQVQKLITKIDPAIAGEEGASPLRFVVVIGKDGRIISQTQVGGSPWLAQAAIDALRQWVYEPTLIDGKPVEVVTEVRVEFKAG
jgi:Gram-negative bacterial TonB protein C-terminal/Tetratricopeptide repeat